MEKAPKDAFCYICLEGDRKSSKLMRGCACRGDSAGFVHVECLEKLAKSQEASDDFRSVSKACWSTCGNCKQCFQGALYLEMARRFWRRHRSKQDRRLRYRSMVFLAGSLAEYGELDPANQLLDEASTCVGNIMPMLLELKLLKAENQIKQNHKLEALGLLQAMLPEVKQFLTTIPVFYVQTLVLLVTVLINLDRYQEAYETGTELVAFTKANFSLDHTLRISSMQYYAVACAKVGRVEEAMVIFEDLLSTKTRIYGRDHPYTQRTRFQMQYFLADPSQILLDEEAP